MRGALVPLLLTACVQNVGPGPDLGACAQPPAGKYTYGEVGIGTCLAGPADIAFFEQDGVTWLAVVNADPYRNFASGSVLLVDFDSLDLSRPVNLLHEVEAHALALDSYVGGVGYLADRELLLVSGRLSEDAPGRTANDEVWVVDVADPTQPELWSEGDSLTLRDDPQPVVVDEDSGLAYIVNITDHSVSVVDTTTTPLEQLDISIDARITPARFFDDDRSGSTAVLFDALVEDAESVISELWSLEWVDGTYRLWLPEDGGLARWSTGGAETIPSGFGLDVDPEDSDEVAEVHDAFYGSIEGFPALYYADRGVIRYVISADGTIGGWELGFSDDPLLAGSEGAWDAWMGSPAVLNIDGAPAMFYDGRTAEGEPASIGLATSEEGLDFVGGGSPVLEAPDGFTSVEDPAVRFDPFTLGYLMWVSLFDGEHWSIGRAESEDGSTWSAVEEVLRLEDADVAAPTVTWANGRYLMWAAMGDGDGWSTASAWSWDGAEWFDLTPVVASAEPADRPPRAALQADASGGWRVVGADNGAQTTLATAGGLYLASGFGMSFRVASGHLIDGGVVGDPAALGLVPGSFAEVDGVPTLYVTAWDESDRPSLVALQELDGRWNTAALDLVPPGSGGNLAGALSPTVWGGDGDWTLYYAAIDEQGLVTTRRATSTDGLQWASEAGVVLEPSGDWDSVEQLPHSVEPLDDGGIRLWYAGFNGSRYRIGAATSADGVTFEPDPGEDFPWQLGTGFPGEFDDSGVRDPMVVRDGDVLHMWYSGSPDGLSWEIGYASRTLGDLEWERRLDPSGGEAVPALGAVPTTFAAIGVESPVVASTSESWSLLYAGFDGGRLRVGEAVGGPGALYPAHRFPTAGDTLEMATYRGDRGVTVISLDQTVAGRTVTGEGVCTARLDVERGFLYVGSKLSEDLLVIDVRDDSSGSWVDFNYLDIEAVITTNHAEASNGYRDVLPLPGTDLLYATTRYPDAVAVFDIAELVDDEAKQWHRTDAVGALPLTMVGEDEGEPTLARIGGAGMALDDDGRTLLVSHFRGNGVAAFDLEQGLHGEEVAWIPHVGENPHRIAMSPDGRYAVVANYLGDVDEDTVSSTLAVIDVEAGSETHLEVLTWLANR